MRKYRGMREDYRSAGGSDSRGESHMAGPARLALLAVFFLLVEACAGPTGPGEGSWVPAARSGAMLVRHGSYLYYIGGRAADGSISSEVFVAPVTGAGEIGAFRPDAPLPEGRTDGVAYAAGHLLYVMGGEDAEGPTDDVFYALIRTADGSLGFTRGWERNERPLPEPRSHSAIVDYDGRVMLIGGRTASGDATDTIIHAAVWPDGQIGQWYETASSLPRPAFSVGAATLDGALIVGGGSTATGPLDELHSFPLHEHARLGGPAELTSLPEAVTGPVLFESGGSLFLTGGTGVGGPENRAYKLAGAWTPVSGIPASAEGPHSARAGGHLYLVAPPDEGDSAGVNRLAGIEIGPAAPTIHPGSGFIPPSSAPIVRAEPGTTVRFRSGPVESLDPQAETVTGSDPIWEGQTVSSDRDFLFRAFRSDGAASPVVGRSYRLRSASFFVLLAGDLEVQEPPHSLRSLRLEERYHDGSTHAVNEAYYKLQIGAPSTVVLTWADDTTDDAAYSSRIETSVFESNLMTTAIDTDGFPAVGRRKGTSAPVRLMLNPGTYYVLFRDHTGASGTSFAAAVYREY